MHSVHRNQFPVQVPSSVTVSFCDTFGQWGEEHQLEQKEQKEMQEQQEQKEQNKSESSRGVRVVSLYLKQEVLGRAARLEGRAARLTLRTGAKWILLSEVVWMVGSGEGREGGREVEVSQKKEVSGVEEVSENGEVTGTVEVSEMDEVSEEVSTAASPSPAVVTSRAADHRLGQ